MANAIYGESLLIRLKVSDSPLILESLKWILRYAQYDGVRRIRALFFKFVAFSHDNRSNGGSALDYFCMK